MGGKSHRGGFVPKEGEVSVPPGGLVKVVEIKKAGAVGDTAPADTTIVISGKPPEHEVESTSGGQSCAVVDFEYWEKNVKPFYCDQADLLFDALVKSLPGGTLDQLAVRLLDKYSTLLRVPL